MTRHFLPLPLLTGAILLGVAGCGSGHGDLAGKITYQGKPVRSGSVGVLGQDGITRNSVILPDGSYQVPDIPAGPVKIAVTSPDPATVKPHPRKKDLPIVKVDRSEWFPLPDSYGDFQQSGLIYTLMSGENTVDIALK
jgi:hypothetical protein